MSSIEAEFFDHRNNGIPFYEGWDGLLKAFFKPIPTIPNGGYTRGHFFEFFEGKVTMRDTITSEIFHNHTYLGNGTLGVMREGLLSRIFGQKPFEDANLEDIILPRHRIKEWDTKKIESFSEKLYSIPSEFRSYYPHNLQQLNNGDVQMIELKKKRGRPLGSVKESSEVKLSNKKTCLPISAGSNSILKYFGGKVFSALAKPSKSISKNSMELSISDLKITITETSASTPIEPSALPQTHSELLASTISAQEFMDAIIPPSKHSHNIIEEDDVFDKVFYGLKWADSSCSFDTALTVLLYFYKSLSRAEKEEFLVALPFFGNIFQNVDITLPKSIAEAKLLMMPVFMDRVAIPLFEIKKYFAVETVHEIIMRNLDNPNSIVGFNYDVTISCATVGCEKCGEKRFNNIENTKRNLNSFESTAVIVTGEVVNKGREKNVKALIKSYWLRKEHKCRICNENMEVVRIFSDVNPILFTVSTCSMDTLIDPIVTIQGSNYSIFAVAYTNGSHFMARIKLFDNYYEYDGLKESGRLRKIMVAKPFAEKIKTLSNRFYESQMIWYKKTD